MSPSAYTVHIAFPDAELAGRFERWLVDEHLAEVLAAGATAVELVRFDAPSPALEVRYRFASSAAFAAYERDHAPRLRAESLARFPLTLGHSFSRTVGDIVANLKA